MDGGRNGGEDIRWYSAPRVWAGSGHGRECARSNFAIDLAYVWLLIGFTVTAWSIGVHAALFIAVALRLGSLLSTRALIAANHHFLEVFVMIVWPAAR